MKLCECGCGDPTELAKLTNKKAGLVKGKTYQRFIVGHARLSHGMARVGCITSEAHTFYAAKARCINPKNKAYANYGGRGIEFRFTSPTQLVEEIGQRPEGLTLDRIDNNGHYERGNVRWATRSEQSVNRRPWKKRNRSAA